MRRRDIIPYSELAVVIVGLIQFVLLFIFSSLPVLVYSILGIVFLQIFAIFIFEVWSNVASILKGKKKPSFSDFRNMLIAYVGFLVVFGFFYHILELILKVNLFEAKTTGPKLLDMMYLSTRIMVTIGSGDVVPTHWSSKLLVMIQSLVSVFLVVIVLAIMVNSLTSKTTRK